MFEAPYCWCCGKKEHFNGYGCNNPESEEAYRAALRDCVEALETAQPYVESSGWTRHRDDEIAQIEAAIDNARKALGE